MPEPSADPVSLDIDGILAAKKPRTVTARLMVDSTASPPLVREFTFITIGRSAWEALLDAYPPTPEQNEAYKEQQARDGVPLIERRVLRYDVDLFPPVAIAAACIDPKMTAEQAAEMWNDERFAGTELEELVQAAFRANEPRDIASLGKGLTETLFSGRT